MGTKENKELVRKFWEVAEKGDYDAFGDYITEDSIDHNPMPVSRSGVRFGATMRSPGLSLMTCPAPFMPAFGGAPG